MIPLLQIYWSVENLRLTELVAEQLVLEDSLGPVRPMMLMDQVHHSISPNTSFCDYQHTPTQNLLAQD